MSPDYAVDYLVEIFENSGSSTGVQFYVQLKSTRKEHRSNVSISIDLEDLRYWQDLPLPVLVVVADVNDKALRFRWAHDLDPWPKSSSDQGSKRFSFGPRDSWDETTTLMIRTYAEAWRRWSEDGVDLPISLSITAFEGSQVLSEVKARAALRRELEPYGSLIHLVPKGVVDVAGVVLECRSKETRFALPAHSHLALDHAPEASWLGTSLGPDLLVGLALTLAAAGQETVSTALLVDAAPRTTLWTNAGMAVAVVSALADGGEPELALRLTKDLGAKGADGVQEWVLAHLGFQKGFKPRHHEELLDLQQDRYQRLLPVDSVKAGTAAYNIGGHHRAAERFTEALDWYDQASHLNPGYKTRGYWHRERGGVFYLLERYEESAEAYNLASRLGDNEAVLPLTRADALINAGHYEDALSPLAEAVKLPGDQGAEARLLQLAVEQISSFLKKGLQKRLSDEALQRITDHPEDWANALALDAVCPPAWESRAVAEDSTVLAAVSASLARYDPRLWAFALLSCADTRSEALGRDCAMVAKRYTGTELLHGLEHLSQNVRLEPSLLEDVFAWYDEAPARPPLKHAIRIFRE